MQESPENRKRFPTGRTGESKGKAQVKMGRHFAKIANAPLKKQNSSDAWNERQNRLTAGRDSAKMLMRGTMEQNKAKRKK